MEEKNLIKIEVSVKELEKKETKEKFLVYKGLTKKGWYDLKFTKDVKEELRPTKYSYIYVDKSAVNINRTQRFPVIWISAIEKFEEVEFTRKTEDYFD